MLSPVASRVLVPDYMIKNQIPCLIITLIVVAALPCITSQRMSAMIQLEYIENGMCSVERPRRERQSGCLPPVERHKSTFCRSAKGQDGRIIHFSCQDFFKYD